MLQGGRWDLQTGPGTGVAGEGRGTFRSFSSQNPREELQAGGGSPGHREAPRLRPPEQPRRAIHSLDSLQLPLVEPPPQGEWVQIDNSADSSR